MTNNRPILFIDSGIGGLPYCIDFHRKNPLEPVCYLADTQNFPYGPREKEELVSILISLTEKLIEKFNPKIIVLACNTATIAALSSLRERFAQIPFVGTVPALKPAANTSRKIGVLGTERTIGEIRNLNLVDASCEIIGIAAPQLVYFIEHNFDKAGANEKKEMARKYIDLFRAEGADSLVLGCTHFLFLLDEFKNEASPHIEVFDSLAGITKRIEFLLDKNNLRADAVSLPSHTLLLTGASDSFWQDRAQKLGFKLELL
ncbi:MAG: glutamate racemase [Treponema sp.]|nr:glutamate racemase [Treponema sp.]